MQTENSYTATDLGNISPNPRGTYDPAATYEYLDLVYLDGGSYLCLVELGKTISGISPESGKTTDFWQCIAIPGGITPEYTAMHDEVVKSTKAVSEDREAVENIKQSVSESQETTNQLLQESKKAALDAETSKDSAAGYALDAETSRQASERAAQTAVGEVQGFNATVAQKIQEATSAITAAQNSAVEAVVSQQGTSVQDVKDQTATYIAEQKESAKAEIKKIVDDVSVNVDEIKKDIETSGTQQKNDIKTAGDTQVTAIANAGQSQKTAVESAGKTQVAAVSAEGTKQMTAIKNATSEIESDREQIKKNTEDIKKKIDIGDAMSWSNWFDLHRTGWHGGVTYAEDSPSSIGTKTGDNANLVVTSSTNTTKNRDDYAGNLLWDGLEVNGFIDEDGEPRITAVKGSPSYMTDGSNGDCYVAFLTGFYDPVAYASGNWDWRDTPADGYIPHPKAIRPDGTYRSFYLIAQYPVSIGADGNLASLPGKKLERKISYANQSTKFREKGSQYCGLTTSDIFWFQSTYEMKYATRRSKDTFTGTAGYNYQFSATIAETNVKRIIISKANAQNLVVNSSVSIGYGSISGSTISLDRGNNSLHAYADSAKILKIEEYDESNSAVYVDVPEAFSTTNVKLNDTLTSPVYITTMPWYSGACDQVKGSDGSPGSPKTWNEPFRLSHVEIGHGLYEIVSDTIFKTHLDADTFWLTPYIVDDAEKIESSITGNYTEMNIKVPDSSGTWKYISAMKSDPKYPYIPLPVELNGSSTTYYGDALYIESRVNNAQRIWLWFGALIDWGNSGLRCVRLNFAPSNAWWGGSARLSSLRRGTAALG